MSGVKVDELTDTLRQRIVSGEFGTAGRLPSLRMFAQQMGTTRETMNKVFQRLQAEGFISSLGPAGVFVRASRTRIPGTTSHMDTYLKQLGLEPVDVTIGTPEVVLAPEDIAHALGVSKNTPVVHRLQRQGTATAYYQLLESFLPAELAGGQILKQMRQNKQFDVLTAIKEAHGKQVRRVHEDVIGRFPTQREQDLLKVVRNTPMLEAQRTYYTEDETTAIMFSRVSMVASFFVLSYDYHPVS
jgi:DNA-binding GntR family transcriptional regulator